MVTINKIYTKTGDNGTSRLSNGQELSKTNQRFKAFGAIDECNSCIGIARIYSNLYANIDEALSQVQNDLFDLGADLANPEKDENLSYKPLRITQKQIDWLENTIDSFNENIAPLDSFILPGGTELSAHLHLARTIARRAEIEIAHLIETDSASKLCFIYANRLSDLLFVLARFANDMGKLDVKWIPAKNT